MQVFRDSISEVAGCHLSRELEIALEVPGSIGSDFGLESAECNLNSLSDREIVTGP